MSLREKAKEIVNDEIENGVCDPKDREKQVEAVIRWLESLSTATLHLMDSGNL